MKRGITRSLSSLGLAALLISPAGFADGSCECWYNGFEDGSEFTWGTRFQSEYYEVCKSSGRLKPYEDGFHAQEERAERRCPYGT
jgi:hypothetical protein